MSRHCNIQKTQEPADEGVHVFLISTHMETMLAFYLYFIQDSRKLYMLLQTKEIRNS